MLRSPAVVVNASGVGEFSTNACRVAPAASSKEAWNCMYALTTFPTFGRLTLSNLSATNAFDVENGAVPPSEQGDGFNAMEAVFTFSWLIAATVKSNSCKAWAV